MSDSPEALLEQQGVVPHDPAAELAVYSRARPDQEPAPALELPRYDPTEEAARYGLGVGA